MLINEIIGQRIREQREKLGLKQQDIANALQVSPQAVSKWERGENAPDISLLIPLAKLLGVSTDNLLGYYHNCPDIFEATVFLSKVGGYPQKAKVLQAQDVATWANGFFFQITETVLNYDGIPVKYLGDTFLCFFSGDSTVQDLGLGNSVLKQGFETGDISFVRKPAAALNAVGDAVAETRVPVCDEVQGPCPPAGFQGVGGGIPVLQR